MNKIQVTAQQRANAIEALTVMWPSVPPDNVYPRLRHFGNSDQLLPERPDCGTVACFGGWCAFWPGFVSQGMEIRYGLPLFDGEGGTGAGSALFGASLFRQRDHLDCDTGFKGTDHALVTRRLNWLIKNSVVVS